MLLFEILGGIHDSLTISATAPRRFVTRLRKRCKQYDHVASPENTPHKDYVDCSTIPNSGILGKIEWLSGIFWRFGAKVSAGAPARMSEICTIADEATTAWAVALACLIPGYGRGASTNCALVIGLACRLGPRWLGFRATSADAVYGKSECRQVPPCKTPHACPASCAAGQVEFHHTSDRARDCRQGVGNNLQAAECNGRSGFGPRCERYKGRC